LDAAGEASVERLHRRGSWQARCAAEGWVRQAVSRDHQTYFC